MKVERIEMPPELQQHSPDAHTAAANDAGEPAGRCSLWWRETPEVGGQRVGIVGHYAAQNGEAGRVLLDFACEQLAAQGCERAVGPMDGSTWRQYRLVTERGAEPPFFLEPDTPDAYLSHFQENGFAPCAQYSSAINTDLRQRDTRYERAEARREREGIHIRTLDIARIDEELRRIHALSLLSFRSNFLFAPISLPDFAALYTPLLPYVRPELVLLAERNNRLVGFLFAVPDCLQNQRGETCDTLVIKTIAVLPGREYAGLGHLLGVQCQLRAHDLGYRRAIHALMHDANNSRNLSGHYAQTMRRYALFSRPLKP